MNPKVLIVDDDPSISKLLQKVMTSNGMDSETTGSGAEALSWLSERKYDLILMDVNLEDMEGFDVIRKVREDGNTTPIIIISGRNEDYDALYGLSIGADDYVTKPFRPVVLGAKCAAVLRRSQSHDSGASLTCGPFRFDTETLRFYKKNEEIILTAKESAIMMLFMKNPDHVFSKEMIYEKVWGDTEVVDDNTIMVYIKRLRDKIEDDPQNPDWIITIRGLGYRFRAAEE